MLILWLIRPKQTCTVNHSMQRYVTMNLKRELINNKLLCHLMCTFSTIAITLQCIVHVQYCNTIVYNCNLLLLATCVAVLQLRWWLKQQSTTVYESFFFLLIHKAQVTKSSL